MERILVIIGKKVLVSSENEIFHCVDCNTQEDVEKQLTNNYNINIIRTELHTELNILLVYAAIRSTLENGYLVTIPSARKKLLSLSESNNPLCEYLRSLQHRMTIQLQFGVRNGRIITISEIKPEEHGNKCNCTCPGCGAELSAKIGKKNQRHFAHRNMKCDITSAQQTALHMLAKEIIEEEKQIQLPGITVNTKDLADKSTPYFVLNSFSDKYEYKPPKLCKCTSVTLERKLSDIIPDIVAVIAGRTLLIEIAVTHFIDDEKRAKIESLGIPLMEIDLSPFHGQLFSKEAIRNSVIYDINNRTWIFNPKISEAESLVKADLNAKITKWKIQQARIRKSEEEALRRKQERRTKGCLELNRLFVPDNYRSRLIKFRDDNAARNTLKSYGFIHNDLSETPFYMDIPITGEIIFACDRRILQSSLFYTFIYYRKKDFFDIADTSTQKIETWAYNYNKICQIDWSINYKTEVTFPNGEVKIISPFHNVIRKYLYYLEMIGFIENYNYYETVVKYTHTLTPPNEQYAALLKQAIKSVDQFAPDIDDLIDNFLTPKKEDDSLSQTTNSRIQPSKEYELGYESITTIEEDRPIIDKFGWRWLICTECGAIQRSDDIAIHGVSNNMNYGICKSCYRKSNGCQ